MFQIVNRNKRGIALDVQEPAGRDVFERLVRWADVYITNHLPRVRRKLRTEPADLFALNPRLVYAKGHGQGQRGPDAEAGGYDGASYWARGSLAHLLTAPEADEPINQRPGIGDIPSGMFLAGAVCAGLVSVLRTGNGVVVDTALLNAATWSLGPDMAYSSLTGAQMQVGSGERSPITRAYRTLDGRFVNLMMIGEERYWAQACRAIGLPELIERYPDAESRRPHWGPLRGAFGKAIAAMSRDELERRLQAEDCIYAFYAAPEEVLDDPAVVDNGWLMPHPRHPQLKVAAAPAQFDDEPLSIRLPGPDLGEHSREVLVQLGYDSPQIEELIGTGVVREPATDSGAKGGVAPG
jgi:crotonobetainyl-CoA:carnitine CoA-transferase CaiB-like acyl-CoA transferase